MSGLFFWSFVHEADGEVQTPVLAPVPSLKSLPHFPAQAYLQNHQGQQQGLSHRKSQSVPWSTFTVFGWGIPGTKASRTQLDGEVGRDGKDFRSAHLCDSTNS